MTTPTTPATSQAANGGPSDNWQQYAKEGETAQQCIERHRGELNSFMDLYINKDGLAGCSCRWKGEEVVARCELHEAWHVAIHEWAERAKKAEAALSERSPVPAGQAVGERSSKDYALEHAEYMAQSAEQLTNAWNDLSKAVQEFEHWQCSESDVDAAQETVNELTRAVRGDIYEFRKRRDRASSPTAAAAPAPQPVAYRKWERPLPNSDYECWVYYETPVEGATALFERYWTAAEIDKVSKLADELAFPAPAPAAQADAQKLGAAIGNAAHRLGIYGGEIPLTGPHLLQLLDDIERAAKPQADALDGARYRWLRDQWDRIGVLESVMLSKSSDGTSWVGSQVLDSRIDAAMNKENSNV